MEEKSSSNRTLAEHHKYQSHSFLLANEGVTTRLQKEMGQMQQELPQLQLEVSQIDIKIDLRLKDFHGNIKGEIRSELHSLFEQYFGLSPSASAVGATRVDKGKGILGGHPSRASKEHLAISLMTNIKYINTSPRVV
ncbi:hypothetical protein J1N35_010204 [Gossypium stocksii]|uniref:Uncharacterized protein n=1 Tax=Gossypium stocksii TaxID=47602 RepID=A0A9D3VZX4_9ROSI|nr:hypothetical protein J1N35_010204 [Gossypium stocksii]